MIRAGKTIRTIQAALNYATEKKISYIVVYKNRWDGLIDTISKQTDDIERVEKQNRIYLKGGGEIIFITPNSPLADLQAGNIFDDLNYKVFCI